MNQPMLVVSRAVVRVAALVLALGALSLGYDPLGPTRVGTADDSGLGVGLAVMLLTLMLMLAWGAVAAVWALVDGLRHGWQIAPVWLGAMAIMFAVAAVVSQAYGFVWAAPLATVPIGLGLLVGASLKTVLSHRSGRHGLAAAATTAPRGAGDRTSA